MDDFMKLLLETFAEEAKETVEALEKALLALERASSPSEREEQYAVLARRAHNLKGAAGAAGVSDIQSLSHALEDGLLALRDTHALPQPEMFDILYAGVDAIRMASAGEPALRPSEDSLKSLEYALRNILDSSSDYSAAPSPPSPPPAVAPSPPTPPVAVSAPSPALPPHAVYAAPPPPPAPTPPLPPAPLVIAPMPPPAPPQPAHLDLTPKRPGGSVAPPSRNLPYTALLNEDGDPSPPPQPAPPPAPAPAPPQSAPAPALIVTSSGPSGPSGPPALAPQPQAQAAQAAQAASRDQTIRVSVDKLDALMNQIGEIITVNKKTEVRLAEMEQLAQGFAELRADLSALEKQLDRAFAAEGGNADRRQDVRDRLHAFSLAQRAIEERFARFHSQTMRDAITENILTERLPEDIKRLRMRPFSTLEDHLRRAVRDAARQCGKQVRFDIFGLDTEADQVVLDALRDPLLHLLRNSVDHGIEGPEERALAGKNPEGEVRLIVEGRSATLLLRLVDDGRGINPEKLRARIRERNLIAEGHLAQMSDREVIDLIFLPGFSTASQVGLISGRGIGMDVVRQVVQQHHGTVSVETVVGRSTIFEMTMPLTFATVQGIIVSVQGHEVAIPIYALERLVRVSRNDIRQIEGMPTVTINGEHLSLVALADLLELTPITGRGDGRDDDELFQPGSQSFIYAAVIRNNDRRIAFIVDEFVGESEMVVKEVPPILGRIPNVTGATITWSGQVMVIVNPSDLLDSAIRRHAGQDRRLDWAFDAPVSRRILVCDDSLTTRTLEKNILVAAGYEVEDAVNGLEALELLERSDFQLIVLDVDMPEMSGFELTARLRAMPAYQDIPIILVTSRDAEDDRRRGLAAGADAYITKQAFTQRTFLETVRRFLE